MKNRLITLLKMCHTLDWAKDRTGVYSLRHVNQFPKFERVARTAAVAPSPQNLADPTDRTDRTDQAKQAAQPPQPGVATRESCALVGRAVHCPPHDGGDPEVPQPIVDGGQGTARPASPALAAMTSAGFLQSAKLKIKAFFVAAAAFVPENVARLRGRLFSPPADPRPRAQAELALEKVKVMRNDLADADLVVVAVQAKPEEPCAARAEGREPAANPWTRVAARWIKLKNPAEDGRPARVAPPMPAAPRVELARTPPLNPC